ncbi:MAG: NUDIX hydrolase [Rhodobacteraceae bacterium]|nr:MAG: NUDIX hydrolase [Paracoccaceae bacterium]
MKTRPRLVKQIAALPVRWDKTGKLRVLMVTSRERGRWVMPKGWHMDGKKPWRAAEIEALEEAGATGFISKRAIGTYRYDKRLDDGTRLPCEVTLYPMVVSRLKRRWKERAERKRHWFAPKKAARLVEEKQLAKLLKELADKPERQAAIEKLRKAA